MAAKVNINAVFCELSDFYFIDVRQILIKNILTL